MSQILTPGDRPGLWQRVGDGMRRVAQLEANPAGGALSWSDVGAACGGGGGGTQGHIDLGLLLANGSDTVGLNIQQSAPASASTSDVISIAATGVIKALDTAWNFTMPVLNNSSVSIVGNSAQLSVQDLSASTIAIYSCTVPTVASGSAGYITVDSLSHGTGTLDISSSSNPVFLAAHIYGVTISVTVKQS